MNKYDTESLPLIAQGGEADIYDIGNEIVLRVLRNPKGRSFRTEKHLFPILEKHSIRIPTVYEYIENEDMTAITMQKITGCTMMDQLKQHPFQIVKGIKKFAEMHAQLLSINSEGKLYSAHEIIGGFTSQELPYDRKLIDFALSILRELPDDNYICHGDFHPGNILIQDNYDYIIDWGAAYRSNYVSDIAHTFLLMTNVPRIPGQNYIQHRFISCMGHIMAKTYLMQMSKLMEFSLTEFSKWTVVMALKRVFYGMPSEKATRIKYINQCYELCLKGVDAATWYKRL